MESTTTRPAVDLSAQKARPGLALILALISIPGLTMGWDLPTGAWPFVPVAVAAIVLGVGARRTPEASESKVALAAIVIATLMLTQIAIWLLVSAVS